MAIKKILVPIDFSAVSENGLIFTAKFCGDDDTKQVTLVHTSIEGKGHQQQLAEMKEKFHSMTDATCVCIERGGAFIDEVLNIQREGDFEIIIMATSGSEKDEWTDTHTSRLVAEADCPVLVIPRDHHEFRIDNIALALGRDKIDDSWALGTLYDIAREFNAKVHILSVEKEEGAKEAFEDKNEAVLEYYLETLDYKYSFPKNDDIEAGIADYVKDEHIDLLAILPRNHAKKSLPSEGKLTKYLTLHSEVPLLTID